jgi:hypothetical protein
MEIVIIVCALILLPLAGYGGFRFGSHFIRQENLVLKNTIAHLEEINRVLAGEAAGLYNLSNQISQMQSNNLTSTMSLIIQLLGTYQIQNASTLNRHENEKISEIINNVKSIQHHERND